MNEHSISFEKKTTTYPLHTTTYVRLCKTSPNIGGLLIITINCANRLRVYFHRMETKTISPAHATDPGNGEDESKMVNVALLDQETQVFGKQTTMQGCCISDLRDEKAQKAACLWTTRSLTNNSSKRTDTRTLESTQAAFIQREERSRPEPQR